MITLFFQKFHYININTLIIFQNDVFTEYQNFKSS